MRTGNSTAWSPVRVSGGTQLFANVNIGIDPYAIDNSGTKNRYFFINGGSLFRMTSANMTLNYSIQW
jgi:hypothetical protein